VASRSSEVNFTKNYMLLFYLQFVCIIDYFLHRALEAACAAYASLNLSILHHITLHTQRRSQVQGQ